MEHLMLKAATTATDEGTFEAVISTASVDRDGDIVEPAALVTALQKWAALGKRVPLAWSHATTTADGQVYYVTVGHIDPETARVVGREVVASGWIDREAQHGQEAWRLVKSGTLSFSYGYLVPEGGATKRRGVSHGYHIKEMDVFEISIVPIAPANNETRVLGWKADVPMVQLLNAMLGMANKFIDQEDDPDDIAAMRQIADRLQTLGAAEASEPDDSTEDMGKALQRRAEELAAEIVTEGVDLKAASAEPEPETNLELQEVKAELAEVREVLENLTKKADVNERNSRSMDPLRAKTDALALEIASDGESLLKPPQKKAEPPKPGLSLKDMRDWWHAHTLETLSEDLNHEQTSV